jgi:hypothetical protein
LGVQSNLILITSEKLKTEFNDLHYIELDKLVKELMGKALEGVTDVSGGRHRRCSMVDGDEDEEPAACRWCGCGRN